RAHFSDSRHEADGGGTAGCEALSAIAEGNRFRKRQLRLRPRAGAERFQHDAAAGREAWDCGSHGRWKIDADFAAAAFLRSDGRADHDRWRRYSKRDAA